MKIYLGSANRDKIKAVKMAFETFGIANKIIPIKTNSNVSRCPSSEETAVGARNRAKSLIPLLDNGDFAIGIEGGYTEKAGFYFVESKVIIFHKKDGEIKESSATSATIPISSDIYDRTVKRTQKTSISIKKILEPNIVEFLSFGNITRAEIDSQAIKSALLPIIYNQRYALANFRVKQH